jgi:hypothetical protein
MNTFVPPQCHMGVFCLVFLSAYLLFAPQPVRAENAALPSLAPNAAGAEKKTPGQFFPSLYFTETINTVKAREEARPYWVISETEFNTTAQTSANESILLNNDIIAFYGHPMSRQMGILGRYSIEDLDDRLIKVAEEYAAVNGERGVRRAFYIIYGTVWPEGEIGIIKDQILLKYIQYALERDILVFIDHQIGRYDPVDALKRMLPYLRYPNVHLALDPEWRTTKPMMEIGTVTAEEINRAQRVMEDYILEHQIPGERMLVIHQFNWRMIRDREKVEAGFDRVRLVHCADGFGNPSLKRQSYAYNAQAANMPIKGFKLFYNFNIPGAGYDEPLLSPREVFALNPRPYVIMYQ